MVSQKRDYRIFGGTDFDLSKANTCNKTEKEKKKKDSNIEQVRYFYN